MRKITNKSPRETFELGEKIGKNVKAGSIICLVGEMGAGKTAITQGIVKGVGIEDYVTSPTYTIVNEYWGELPVYHFDVFRIEDIDELYEIGFEEYMEKQGVIIIEWATIIKEILPEDYLWISIEKGKLEEERIITLQPKGKSYNDLIKEL